MMNNNSCQRRECGCFSVCDYLIPGILVALLSFTVGLIIGAVATDVILENIAAFLVFAVVLFVLVVIWIIVRTCRCRRS